MRLTRGPEPERSKSTFIKGYCFSNMSMNCLLSGIATVVYQVTRPSFFAWAMRSGPAVCACAALTRGKPITLAKTSDRQFISAHASSVCDLLHEFPHRCQNTLQ